MPESNHTILLADEDDAAPLRPTGPPAAHRDTEDTMSRRDPHPALATQPTCRHRPSSTTTGPSSSALEISHAARLRHKVQRPGEQRLVVNVWGVGWRLSDPPAAGAVR
jgi:hypothetical protein